jgi:selenocysteine lyase/cysteine desulfurase
MVGAAALFASLELFLKVREHHGESAIQDRILELVAQLDEALRAVGAVPRSVASPRNRSGILTFEVPGVEPAEVRRRALAEQVVVSCRGGGVRASVHAYNNSDDLTRLVDVVRGCR